MSDQLNESFPYYSEDGYHARGGWDHFYFWGLYRDTHGMPYQLNKLAKKKKPIAQFIVGIQRGRKEGEKTCWFGCHLIYGFSLN